MPCKLLGPRGLSVLEHWISLITAQLTCHCLRSFAAMAGRRPPPTSAYPSFVFPLTAYSPSNNNYRIIHLISPRSRTMGYCDTYYSWKIINKCSLEWSRFNYDCRRCRGLTCLTGYVVVGLDSRKGSEDQCGHTFNFFLFLNLKLRIIKKKKIKKFSYDVSHLEGTVYFLTLLEIIKGMILWWWKVLMDLF